MTERPRLSVKLLWRGMLAPVTSESSKVSMTSSGSAVSAGAYANADGPVAVEVTTGTVESAFVWLARGSNEAGRA